MANERSDDATEGLVAHQALVDGVAPWYTRIDLEAVQDVRGIQDQPRVVFLVPLRHDTQVTHDTHDELGRLHFGQGTALAQGCLDLGPAITKVELLADKGLGSLVALGHIRHEAQAHLPAGTLLALDARSLTESGIMGLQGILDFRLANLGEGQSEPKRTLGMHVPLLCDELLIEKQWNVRGPEKDTLSSLRLPPPLPWVDLE